MNTSLITQFPEIATSNLRELQWSIDWQQKLYAEASEHVEIAWKMYDDAIENNDSREEKDALCEIARMFEAQKIAAWHKWQNAKRDYLAMMN